MDLALAGNSYFGGNHAYFYVIGRFHNLVILIRNVNKLHGNEKERNTQHGGLHQLLSLLDAQDAVLIREPNPVTLEFPLF